MGVFAADFLLFFEKILLKVDSFILQLSSFQQNGLKSIKKYFEQCLFHN